MQDGPRQLKPSYSKAEIIMFTGIAGLPYDAKRLAIARLTAEQRSKFNDFYQNISSDYNEGTTATVRPVFKRTPLAAIIDHVEEEEEENDTPSVCDAAVTTESASALIYSRTTSSKRSAMPIEENDAHLTSLLKDLDLSSSDEEEAPRKRTSRPKAS